MIESTVIRIKTNPYYDYELKLTDGWNMKCCFKTLLWTKRCLSVTNCSWTVWTKKGTVCDARGADVETKTKAKIKTNNF